MKNNSKNVFWSFSPSLLSPGKGFVPLQSFGMCYNGEGDFYAHPEADSQSQNNETFNSLNQNIPVSFFLSLLWITYAMVCIECWKFPLSLI